MKTVKEKKIKLEQKKNRLAAEEMRLKLKERKARTRHLIELGGLVVKADLHYLPTNTLYGALVSLSDKLDKDNNIRHKWTEIGKQKLEQEAKLFTPAIVKFNDIPEKELRDSIRSHGLKWNKFRSEWYGNVNDIESLKNTLKNVKHSIEILNTDNTNN
ncbi:MAG: conjugal transfer protein TraD [Proteobacteria bacterium]|nr:conjugal transfer protein TraD [Pseudomonadota bacterium]